MNQSPPNDPQRGTSGEAQPSPAPDEAPAATPRPAESAAPEPRAAAVPEDAPKAPPADRPAPQDPPTTQLAPVPPADAPGAPQDAAPAAGPVNSGTGTAGSGAPGAQDPPTTQLAPVPQAGGFGPPQAQPPATPAPTTPAPAQQPPAAAPQPGFGAPQGQPPAAQPPGFGSAPQAQPPASAPQSGGYGTPQPPQPGGYGVPQPPAAAQPGFGAPQPPQPGGYGTPQPPPPGGYATPPGQQPAGFGAAPHGNPTPGYAYPQPYPHPTPQPHPHPTAPPQPHYGYPQGPPPPTGYAYPGQPQPYGYPYGQHPTAPYPAPKAAGQRTVVYIVVAAVLAIALIAGVGFLYANSGGGGGKQDTAHSSGGTGGTGGKNGSGGATGGKEKAPADPGSKMLFQVPLPQTANTVVTAGSWLTDDVYAKSGVAEITGYDPADGTRQWTLKLPGPVCSASRQLTDDGRTAIVFQPEMNDTRAGCSRLAAVDLTKGTLLWTKTVGEGDFPVTFDNVTVSGRTVAAGSNDGGAAFDIDSGNALWQPKRSDGCYDVGYGGGPRLVAVRKCGGYDNPQLHIQTIDPKSGKVFSEYKMAPGIEYASVVSTVPLVVAADVGHSAGDGSGISDYFSIDGKTGKLLTRISAPGDTYGGKCDSITKVEDCRGVVAGNGRLYLATEEHDGTSDKYSKTNEIVAFDLTTGKQTGQRAPAGNGYTLYPLRMDGTSLLAYNHPPYDKGGQVLGIDGASFKAVKLLENPATQEVHQAEATMPAEYAELRFANGRLFMSAVYAHKVSYGKEYLVLAFGTDG
ncbi:PQQ-binding-like beta-propeller repeat protein [Streptomyces sp. NPDC059575]|uniref:outer membrane protein assembly factor BamB family protein n=1 Tax=Streptomyces sp. NPDC059575 TaxID=3346872 RepID=UPI00369AD1B7